MKEYYLEVWGSNGTWGTCNFHGANAIEAFELAVTTGQLDLPYGEEVDIVATCETGLVIKFRAQLG